MYWRIATLLWFYHFDGYTLFVCVWCGISIDTHLFWYRNLRCLTYFIRMKSKAYAKRMTFGIILCQSARIMNQENSEESIECLFEWVVSCVVSETVCLRHDMRGSEIHLSFYWFWNAINPNNSNYWRMMIACVRCSNQVRCRKINEVKTKSASKSVWVWPIEFVAEVEEWSLFIAFGHRNPFASVNFRECSWMEMENTIKSQWPN